MSGPTPKAAYPLATDGKVPFLFPRNMDLSLRGTVNHEVFCLRVSFADELKLAIDEAIKKRGLKRLALLEQGDALGASTKRAANPEAVVIGLGSGSAYPFI